MAGGKGLRGIWNARPKLSEVRPFTIFLIYIAAIFMFGGIYTQLTPPSFYAPYTRFEPAARMDANRVAADLYGIIENSLARLKAPRSRNDWQIDPASIGISDVSISAENELTFTVKFNAWSRAQPGALLGWSLHASVPLRERIIFEVDKRPVITRLIRLQPRPAAPPDALNISDETFAEQLFKSSDSILIAPALSWDEDQESRVTRFAIGRAGDPSGVSDELGRMMYFSAIIITSVGFGDIVPLTPMARFLVAFEAVLGWTLAGFFLNAVARRLGNRLEKAQPMIGRQREPGKAQT